MDFLNLVNTLLAMGGFASLVAIVINVLKAVKVVKDGQAGLWSAGLNLGGLILLYVLKIYDPEFDTDVINTHMAQIAEILSLVFAYVMQFFITKTTHGVLSDGKAPVIGKSFSKEIPF
jgi:hypothetical protein